MPPKNTGIVITTSTVTVPLIAFIWAKHYEAQFHIPAKPLRPREFGQIACLKRATGHATLDLVEWVIQNWEMFAREAARSAGYGGSPDRPNIGFLLAHRSIAVRLMYRSLDSKAVKDDRDQLAIKQLKSLL